MQMADEPADIIDLPTFEDAVGGVYILMQTVNAQMYWRADRVDHMADQLVKMVQDQRASAEAQAGGQGGDRSFHLRHVVRIDRPDNVLDFLSNILDRLAHCVDMLMKNVPAVDALEEKLVNLVLEKKTQRLAMQMADELADRSFH